MPSSISFDDCYTRRMICLQEDRLHTYTYELESVGRDSMVRI